MNPLRLIPLDDTVVFPGMSITLTVNVGDDEQVALVPRHESEFAEVGIVARVSERVRLPGGGHAVAVEGLHRALIGAAHTGAYGDLYVEVEEHQDPVPNDGKIRNLTREYRAVVEEILEVRGADGRIAAWLRAISEPGALADSCGYSPDLSYEQRLELLRTIDVTERLELALTLQRERLAELQIRKRIRDDVQEGADKQQRDYFLRKQMDSIRKELGEDDASVVEEYRTKIEEAGMPEQAHEQAVKELGRLERMGEQSGEASMIRTYLDWMIALPWSKRSDERLDPVGAREVLDADHAGLEDVKDRVTEYLAVRKLRQDRGIEADPRSGLLEVLDPAQNHSFRDHYLDVELDLSQVLFIATANQADTIPGALLDRMEVINFDGYTSEEKLAIAKGYLWPRQRDRNGLLDGEVTISDALLGTIISEYTREAGVRNLERELGKALRKTATRIASGGAQPPVELDLDAIRDALGRQRFFQESAARTAVPGVATGLAVTGTGGDVLFVEATAMRTHATSSDLLLTGQLGDVMKESARIALSYVRGHAHDLGIPEEAFEEREFHIHVPAGAIPKDGPSAGVTMVTALASLLSGRPVRHTVGMTGEVTLQGRVLPIGGLKQKALAAHAAGLTDVVIPERNRGDLDEVPQEVRDAIRFHPVMTVGEVLEVALEPVRDVALS